MNTVNRNGLTISQFVLLIILATILVFLSVWLVKAPDKGVSQDQTQKVVEAPEKIIFALANLEGDVGSIEEQREDIEKISEALNSRTVTSEALGKKGDDWLTKIRRRVDVREAIEAWEELKNIDTKSMFVELTEEERNKVPRLRKIVEAQILSCYAKEEGLNCNHGQIGNLVDRIAKK
jgi:hypothetical protein